MSAALHGLAGGTQALERAEQNNPALRTEIELWQLEHEALERRAASLSVEIDKKFSLPAACVVFVLLGAPLGMRVRRAGPAVAFVSVAFFLFYYLCLVGGEELANRLLLPPWFAMWLPNIVLGAWGVGATLRAIELWRPGAPFALLRGRLFGRPRSSPALAGRSGGQSAA
jgi:lipopolysaccharide export LptBFGC system permease protein LptF